MNGIIVINKPENFTSFDVVAKMRGILKTRKIGHSGTLDPMATGVLPVLIGKATRAAELLPNHDKSYIASFRLGMTTDTLDITGEVTSQNEVCVSRNDIERVLERFRGDITQIPPMYSAVTQNGVRLYKLARQGIEVERPPRNVTVYDLKLLSFDGKDGQLSVTCSKGTYVRTLTDDIGRQLGCGAVMTSLVRTMASGYTLDEALTINEVQKFADEGSIEMHILPVDSAFKQFPAINVTYAQAKRFLCGAPLSAERLKVKTFAELQRVYFEESFLGLGRFAEDKSELKVYKTFGERNLGVSGFEDSE